ncbi:MAG: prepilin-type N-terminal cleavage/methylation domain-containing protein [Patescibacteria group bacterium]|nr:MAG: prepilin-type N-terminal cleavage/methylation domain-containing protein [Patescibacteria group bacterium]
MKTFIRQGFTIIEIAVTLAIVAVIFTFILANSGTTKNSTGSRLAIEALTSDIRMAANKALASETFQLEEPGGWGIFIDAENKTYAVFADLNSDNQYELKEKYKDVDLPETISSLSFTAYSDPPNGLPSPLTIVFPLQRGEALVNGVLMSLEAALVLITIQDNKNGMSADLWVNSSGAVGVEFD